MPNQDPTTLVEALKAMLPFLGGIPSVILDPILFKGKEVLIAVGG